MSFLEKLRASKLQPQTEMAAPTEPVKIEVPIDIDEATAKKAGNLSAYGLTERDVCDILLISHEQFIACKEHPEFKKSHAEQAALRAQQAIDLADGWDSAEDKALTLVLETLRTNRDPKYALQVAYIANKAQRRVPNSVGRVIDAARAGTTITLTLNKTFINVAAPSEETPGTRGINVSMERKELPKRVADVITPQRVSALLGVPAKTQVINELEGLLDAAGVHPDLIDREG